MSDESFSHRAVYVHYLLASVDCSLVGLSDHVLFLNDMALGVRGYCVLRSGDNALQPFDGLLGILRTFILEEICREYFVSGGADCVRRRIDMAGNDGAQVDTKAECGVGEEGFDR